MGWGGRGAAALRTHALTLASTAHARHRHKRLRACTSLAKQGACQQRDRSLPGPSLTHFCRLLSAAAVCLPACLLPLLLLLFYCCQVDRASAMIEKLCTPSDDDHNEHKKLQLRELAALNGTLKEVTECYLCGMEGHTPEMCPNKVSVRGCCSSSGWCGLWGERLVPVGSRGWPAWGWCA